MVFAYYIMPKYDMSLAKYVKTLTGFKKIEKIIEVICQLMGSLKYLHTCRRTFNDLKPDNVMINTN